MHSAGFGSTTAGFIRMRECLNRGKNVCVLKVKVSLKWSAGLESGKRISYVGDIGGYFLSVCV